MEERTIELNTNVHFFKEIFFKNGQGSVFRNNLTKMSFRTTLFLALMTIGFYFLGVENADLSWLFIIFLVFTFIAFIFFAIAAVKFNSWKKTVKAYLNNVEVIKESKLTLREDLFKLQVDEKTIIERFSVIKKVTINPTYISIYGQDEHYLFPSKSMKPEEYSFFITCLKDRVL